MKFETLDHTNSNASRQDTNTAPKYFFCTTNAPWEIFIFISLSFKWKIGNIHTICSNTFQDLKMKYTKIWEYENIKWIYSFVFIIIYAIASRSHIIFGFLLLFHFICNEQKKNEKKNYYENEWKNVNNWAYLDGMMKNCINNRTMRLLVARA